MIRRMFRYAVSAASCFILAVSASAQTPPPPPVQTLPPASGQTTTEAVQPVRAKQVLGATVSIAGDVSVGTVDDMVFDGGGNIEYVIVNKDSKLVTVPWSAVKFNFEHKTATINVTQQQYQAIPTYTVQTYPNYYDTTYRTRVYGWYGLTPGELRRWERRR
jgi:hypothetical protein